MSPKKSALVLLAIFVAACGGRSKMQRDQQQYDVVQEGSASGVTSTINAPGDTTPAPPLTSSTVTGTNIDTTTAFTLPGTVTGTTTDYQPGTIAGTLPTGTSGFPPGYVPPRPRPRPTPQAVPPMSSSTSTAAPPPTTETTAPTTTDTVAPTTTDTTGTSSEHPPTDTTGTQGHI
jgi:hypothetical protein